jgi:hypothetical protein
MECRNSTRELLVNSFAANIRIGQGNSAVNRDITEAMLPRVSRHRYQRDGMLKRLPVRGSQVRYVSSDGVHMLILSQKPGSSIGESYAVRLNWKSRNSAFFMKPNPSQPLRDASEQDPQEGEWFKLRLFFPIAWTLFLFFLLPTVQRLPVGLRVISTIVTIAASPYLLAR